MSEVSKVIDKLEDNVRQLLQKQDELSLKNREFSQQIDDLNSKLEAQQQEISEWKEKYDVLKMANSMVGSSESKTAAKLKINTLIREIDHCIAQLSD